MGYTAHGTGSIKIKAGVSEETLRAALAKAQGPYACFGLEISGPYTLTGQTFVDLSHDDNYREDEVYDTLGLFTEIAESGVIEFEGEDGNFWKIELKDGEWKERQGRVVYDLSEFSTEELQEELDRREREFQEERNKREKEWLPMPEEFKKHVNPSDEFGLPEDTRFRPIPPKYEDAVGTDLDIIVYDGSRSQFINKYVNYDCNNGQQIVTSYLNEDIVLELAEEGMDDLYDIMLDERRQEYLHDCVTDYEDAENAYTDGVDLYSEDYLEDLKGFVTMPERAEELGLTIVHTVEEAVALINRKREEEQEQHDDPSF